MLVCAPHIIAAETTSFGKYALVGVKPIVLVPPPEYVPLRSPDIPPQTRKALCEAVPALIAWVKLRFNGVERALLWVFRRGDVEEILAGLVSQMRATAPTVAPLY